VKLIPNNPADAQAEREAWLEGVHILDKINVARAQTNEEPLEVNPSALPFTLPPSDFGWR
jgi:hypothetical protein